MEKTEKRQNVTWLLTVLEAVATRLIIASGREEVLGDALLRRNPRHKFERLESMLFVLCSEAQRFVDPAARARRTTIPAARRRLFDELYGTAYRTSLQWLVISTILSGSNLQLIPLAHGIGFLLGLMPGVLWTIAFWLHLDGSPPQKPENVSLSVFRDPYRLELEARLKRLWTGEWNPGAFFWRSMAEALFFVFMGFPLLFVIVQRLFSGALPANLDWTGIWQRFAACLTILMLWIGVRKTHQATARVFQDELNALDAARGTSMSA